MKHLEVKCPVCGETYITLKRPGAMSTCPHCKQTHKLEEENVSN